MCRRLPGARSTRFGTSAGFAHAAAERCRCRSRQTYAPTSSGSTSSASSQYGELKLTRLSGGRARARAASRRTSRARRAGRPSTRATCSRARARPRRPRRSGGGASRCACRRGAAVRSRDRRARARPRSAAPARAGSRISTAITSCRPGELEQRPAPVVRPAEVGDDDDERALARERVRPADRLAERGRADPFVRPETTSVRSRSAESRPISPRRPWRTGAERGLRVAERHDAEAVAAARRHVPDRDRDALRHVGLAPVGGAEVHRRRRVEDEPRHEDALGLLHADVRLARCARSRSSRSVARRRRGRTDGSARARCPARARRER